MSTTLKIIFAALGGGAIWKIAEYIIDYAGLRKGAQAEFRDDLMAQVGALRQRVNQLESDLQQEQRARVRAELRNEVLARRVELLVRELNRLREEQGMEALDPDDFQVSELPFGTDGPSDLSTNPLNDE